MKRVSRVLCVLVCSALVGACSGGGNKEARDQQGTASVMGDGDGGPASVTGERDGATPTGPSQNPGTSKAPPGSALGDAGPSVNGADAGSQTSTGSGNGPGDAGGQAAADAGSADSGNSQPGSGSIGATSDASGPFPTNGQGQVLCNGVPCACDDGVDNDGDGETDLADPECVARWDNDEGSFATGMPGDNRDNACQDCFFDGNSGSGNDHCRIPNSCLLSGDPSSGHGSCSRCEQPTSCVDFCKQYTPNGCDCFGCCQVDVAGTIKHVLLQAGCDLNGTTLTGCTECVPNPSCNNDCGTCELCAGKTLQDLPPECFPADAGTPAMDSGIPTEPPTTWTCDNGQSPCGEGLPLCADGSLCQFGCCAPAPTL